VVRHFFAQRKSAPGNFELTLRRQALSEASKKFSSRKFRLCDLAADDPKLIEKLFFTIEEE
jgi:hypothetical protein